ncbi:MAG TPA: hypothetical protein VKM55_01715 [Candidatus Lokiarchaeia archaeon]|nr:hypothetical protein [Candidatus Lokiarchaeia archaeon]
MLPNVIGKLESLKKLDLDCCGLLYLPKAIGKLRSLQELNLDFNRLKTLPDTIGQLASLKSLHIDRNTLGEMTIVGTVSDINSPRGQAFINRFRSEELLTFPRAITNLTNLTDLYLVRDSLTVLPGGIDHWIEDLEKRDCTVHATGWHFPDNN